MLGAYETANFLQPCLCSTSSGGLAAGITELLLPCLVFLEKEERSLVWLLKDPK